MTDSRTPGGQDAPSEPLRLTTARWFNHEQRVRDSHDGWHTRWVKKLAHTGHLDQFAYGTDTESDWQRRPGDGPFQTAIICYPGSGTIAVDVDDPAVFAATRTGQILGRQHAISTRGPDHYHILIDARGVPLADWPGQGFIGAPGVLFGEPVLLPAGHIKSNGFIPMPGSEHYSGERYEPQLSAEGLSTVMHGRPALIAAILADRAEWDAAHRERSASGVHGGGGTGGGHDGEVAGRVLSMVRRGLSKEECYAEWLTIAIPRDPAWPFDRDDFERHHGTAVRKAAQTRAAEAEQAAAFEASRAARPVAAGNPGPAAPGALSQDADVARALRRAALLEKARDNDWVQRQMAAGARPALALEMAADVRREPPPPELVAGMMAEGACGVAFGGSGVYKSFLALHLMLCVGSAGASFCGHEVKAQGCALYVMGEGVADSGQRVAAALNARPGFTDAHLGYVRTAFPLSDEAMVDQVVARCRELAERTGLPVALVVLDSFADFYGAADNENSATDMQRLIAAMRRISDATKGSVLANAHTGWEGDHQRGSSRLHNAWDFEWEVAGGQIICRKVRYGPEFSTVSFAVRSHGGSLVIAEPGAAGVMAAPDWPHPATMAQVRKIAEAARQTGGLAGKPLVAAAGMAAERGLIAVRKAAERGWIVNKGSDARPRYYVGVTEADQMAAFEAYLARRDG
jgi:hypothetical protein